MQTIAIISEGITDQVFLEELIFKCIEFDDEPEFIYAQPIRDATHEHTAPHGGWELVLEFCELRMRDTLETNDFTIVQIDTDCGDHPNFGLELSPGGVDKEDSDLIADTIEIIRSKISGDLLASYGDRLIFAVCVHSLETWIILSLYGETKKKSALNHLQRRVAEKGFKKNVESYLQLSKLLKTKDIAKRLNKAESMGVFLDDFCDKFDVCALKF